MLYPKRKRIENPELIKSLKGRPCVADCGKPGEAHHVTSVGAGGSDVENNLMNLCREHHGEWDAPFKGPSYCVRTYGGIRKWLQDHDRWDVLDRLSRLQQYGGLE